MKRILASLALGAGFASSCGGRTSGDFDGGDYSGSGASSARGGEANSRGGATRGGAQSGGGTQTSGGSPVTAGGTSAGGAIMSQGGRGPGGRSGGGRSGGGRSGVGGQISVGGQFTLGGTTFGGATFGGTTNSGGSATGGVVGLGGGPVMCPGLAPNEELIDDMNDGDRFIPFVNGRAGAWSDAHDPTPNVPMVPDPAGPFTMTFRREPCRVVTAQVSGGPFSIWGAVFGFGLGSPYNAKQYRGISFWIRAEVGTTTGLRVSFPDQYTHPNGGLCSPSAPGPMQCYDHYGKRIFVTNSWTKVVVYFSELTQDGWGLQAPFDPSSLYEVSFQIPVNAVFNLGVDDVAFVF